MWAPQPTSKKSLTAMPQCSSLPVMKGGGSMEMDMCDAGDMCRCARAQEAACTGESGSVSTNARISRTAVRPSHLAVLGIRR